MGLGYPCCGSLLTNIHTDDCPRCGWLPISTAPRDGTEVDLTWMEDGQPQEIYPMRWNIFAGNPLVQRGKGIWAMQSAVSGALLCTWSEEDPDGAPTHWRARQGRDS